MRQIKYAIILIATLFVSCEGDFLERNPIDFLAPNNFQTERDIKEAVNGIYRAYISDKNEPIYLDFCVDNAYFPDYKALWSRTITNETNFVVNKWTWNYKVILRANTVLHFIDQVPLSEKAYNQYKGEAKFMRALAYFDLSVYFGAAPLRLKPEGLEDADKALTSREELTGFVMKELDEAAELLPPSYSAADKGRATKGSALAIAARASIFNKKYDDVITYCGKIKELDCYKIMPEYKTLFLPEGEAGNLETIFDMQYETNNASLGLSNEWYSRFYLWNGYQVSHDLYEQYYSTNGLSINDPNNTLYDETVLTAQLNYPSTYVRQGGYDSRFINRDPRMNMSIVVPYSIDYYDRTTKAPGVFYPTDKKSANFTSFRVKKYIDYNNNGVGAISGVNPVIIRYADILLMEAEAWVEKGGTYDEDYVFSLINQVRQRPSVMMPKVQDVEGTGLTPQQLRDIIRHERRIEFAFEGLRLFDVMRWDIGEDAFKDLTGFDPAKLTRYASHGMVYEVISILKRTYDPEVGYRWPIPKTELDANKLIQ